jgi:hypothetical protein
VQQRAHRGVGRVVGVKEAGDPLEQCVEVPVERRGVGLERRGGVGLVAANQPRAQTRTAAMSSSRRVASTSEPSTASTRVPMHRAKTSAGSVPCYAVERNKERKLRKTKPKQIQTFQAVANEPSCCRTDLTAAAAAGCAVSGWAAPARAAVPGS